MDRTANCISLSHPERGRRQLRFNREGRTMHATGGVWGEPDWFETLGPSTRVLAMLELRLKRYLADGFVLGKVRIHDRAAAAKLGLPTVEKPASIARAKAADLTRGQERATALLAEPVPGTRPAVRAQLARAKAVYLEPLGRPLRQRVRDRIEQLDAAQGRLAPTRSGGRRRP